ncbi:MAG TPA: site-specific DNA-methyltransferase [Thermoplasmata archaeon]|nr:site-specific DNA-methyltransferase [Thermoplasmata archaeon]
MSNNTQRRKKDSARLTWSSKPRRAPNPKDIDFQTAEIVIPNPQRDQLTIAQFRKLVEYEIDKTKMNRLIWGDNMLAMQALLASGYEGKINLIYIDPPFWTSEDYYANFVIEGKGITKEPSVIERLAYKDIWAGGIDSYLDMLYPRLQLMKRLLAENGLIYVHIDWHVGHYVKVIMDEIFGKENFKSEIIINRGRRKNLQSQFETIKTFGTEHDVLYLYQKSELAKLKAVKSKIRAKEAQWQSFWRGNVERPTMQYELLGFEPTHGQFLWKKERAEKAVENYNEFEKNGETDLVKYWEKTGKKLEFVRYTKQRSYPEYWIPPKDEGLIGDVWLDIQSYSYTSGYNTEKHSDLLARVIESATDQDAIIADFFAGSGTTLTVAEKLNRKWIGCDFSKVAIQITRNRLVSISAKPFLFENIGNYQRQMIYLHGGRIYEMQRIILKLYGATPRKDFRDMGVREAEDGVTELVYVSYPDRPVTAKKVEELAEIAERLDGTGYRRLVILGWDYEYNYEELLNQRKRASTENWNVEVISKMIPPEVYDYLKKAKSEEELEPLKEKIFFHEKPYLRLSSPEIEYSGNKAEVTLGIQRYVLFDIPIEKEKERAEVAEIAKSNFAALIDYWAVDWNYDGIAFKALSQAFRGFGKRAKTVPVKMKKELETDKEYTAAVRLIDIFGNDATATTKIDLRNR